MIRTIVTRMMRGALPPAAAAAGFILLSASFYGRVSPDDFHGLDARGIVDRIAAECRPASYVDDDAWWPVVKEYASEEGGIRDCFSESVVSESELSLLHVVDVSWFEAGSESCDAAMSDLHNVVPADPGVASVRRDYPPGVVERADYDNGTWAAGVGSIDGMETNLYRPPKGLEGDFARIYMYMAVMYQQPLWHGRAVMLYVDGGFPLISRYGRETLMRWHREDPVDDRERLRNSVIAARQGNDNPFVTIPELAEYVWGDRSGSAFDPEEEPEEGLMPLKAVYSRVGDGHIDFVSPYVDDGSEWTFDGRKVEGVSIGLDDVADGKHEVAYGNSRSRGRVIITIEP